MSKTFVGSQLRKLRRERQHTQAEMAKNLGVSAAYINMLENNQRSLSVQMLIAVSDAYQVDLRKLAKDPPRNLFADLRNVLQDPVFEQDVPDLQELRAAIDHAPHLVSCFMSLQSNHRNTLNNLMRHDREGAKDSAPGTSPENLIYRLFRSNDNYFDALELAAEQVRESDPCSTDEVYFVLKQRLKRPHSISVKTKPIEDMQDALRLYNKNAKEIYLSEALDFQNRLFQLAHVLCLVEFENTLAKLTASSGITTDSGIARCYVELANYFASALLMPYRAFRKIAENSKYDVDRIASKFNTSYEQVSHRLTTLQRPSAKGVPFFFLRIDKAGIVTKRFNATPFNLAEFGGACPVWNIHLAFRTPGENVPQFVELPDGQRFFTLSRTADRPSFNAETQNHRLVVAIGCEMEFAHKVDYAKAYNFRVPKMFSPIGINCHVCQRQACSQRAHQPLFMELSIDPKRRRNTRYES